MDIYSYVYSYVLIIEQEHNIDSSYITPSVNNIATYIEKSVSYFHISVEMRSVKF